MRPFRCPDTILNTIDHLGKLDGKVDEGTGQDWLFDIDARTKRINYEPIVAGTISNGFAGTKVSDNAGQARKETKFVKDYILLPLWTTDPSFFQDPKSSHDNGFKPSDNELPIDPNMLSLEDVSTFNFLSNDEDDGIMADMNNLDITIQIEEVVYVCQPLGFKHVDFPDRVYKVEKALYELHQAPRAHSFEHDCTSEFNEFAESEEWAISSKSVEETMKEKDVLKEKLTKFEESSKNLTKLINSQMSANDKTGLGYDSQLSENEMPKCEIFETASDSSVSEIDEDNNQAKDRYKVGIGYDVVLPPYTGNYMLPRANLSFAGLDDYVFKFNISETKTSVNENELIASKSSEEIREEPKTVRSSAPIIEDWESDYEDECEDKTSTKQEISIATKSGQVLVNAAKQTSATSTSTVRPKGKNVTTIRPKAVVNAAEGKKENAVKHMTSNKSILTEYQKIDGVFVAFGDSLKGEFKLLDESQVLFKVPRQNNMYNFDLKNVVSLGDLTYLFANATIDESNLWH
nr:reverse transcriptase [Tanacetum cinerariifolium]